LAIRSDIDRLVVIVLVVGLMESNRKYRCVKVVVRV